MKCLSDLSELQWRILAALEEAGLENLPALAIMAADSDAAPVEWASMKGALVGLIDLDQVRVSLDASHAGKIRTLKSGAQLSAIAKRGVRPWPMSKEESLAILAEVDAELTADPQYATAWIDILVTDEGRETCARILDRRGYEWWRRR